MIVQVLNSGVVSGPEMLVLPALSLFQEPQAVVFLVEKRWGEKGRVAEAYARKLGLRVETVEVRGRIDFRAVKELRRVLKELSPRVVHAHDVKASTYAWLASRGESWKTASTHHGVEGRPDWITRLYEYFYSQYVLPKMHAAIAVSRYDEFVLQERGHEGVTLQFVANGVTRHLWSAEERQKQRKALREKWKQEIGSFSDETTVIGMIARLSEEKRHSYMLRALLHLKEIDPGLSWKFLAIGSGNLEAELKKESESLGLEGHCFWLGQIENASTLIPGFDLLVLSSSAEGLPIVALEAGWAGVPILASNVGMLPEIISTGKTAGGAIFPREQEPEHTAKSLSWLLRHPRELERMGERLQKRVQEEYSAEAWVARMESIYRTI